MSATLNERLEQVEDAASFLAFVRALREDRLRALAAPETGAWAHLAGANPWRCAATFLRCGSLYE